MTVQRRKSNLAILVIGLAAIGTSVSVAGCDKDDDETEETSPDPTPPPPPPPPATAAPDDTVASYPDQTKMGGTVRLLRSFQVRQAADSGSKLLAGLARGTLVDLKAQYRQWVLINYPSGPGQLSPGWINTGAGRRHLKTVKRPDAGLPVPDGGVTVPDAGTVEVDAGTVEVDAGKDETVDAGADDTKDAGKEEEVKDAGTPAVKDAGKKTFKFKLPKFKIPRKRKP